MPGTQEPSQEEKKAPAIISSDVAALDGTVASSTDPILGDLDKLRTHLHMLTTTTESSVDGWEDSLKALQKTVDNVYHEVSNMQAENPQMKWSLPSALGTFLSEDLPTVTNFLFFKCTISSVHAKKVNDFFQSVLQVGKVTLPMDYLELNRAMLMLLDGPVQKSRSIPQASTTTNVPIPASLQNITDIALAVQSAPGCRSFYSYSGQPKSANNGSEKVLYWPNNTRPVLAKMEDRLGSTAELVQSTLQPSSSNGTPLRNDLSRRIVTFCSYDLKSDTYTVEDAAEEGNSDPSLKKARTRIILSNYDQIKMLRTPGRGHQFPVSGDMIEVSPNQAKSFKGRILRREGFIFYLNEMDDTGLGDEPAVSVQGEVTTSRSAGLREQAIDLLKTPYKMIERCDSYSSGSCSENFVQLPDPNVASELSAFLIANINMFSAKGGFNALKVRLRDSRRPVDLGTAMIFVRSVLAIQPHFSSRNMKVWETLAAELLEAVRERLHNLSDVELRSIQQYPRPLVHFTNATARLGVSSRAQGETEKKNASKVQEQMILEIMVDFLRLASIEARLFGLHNILEAVRAYSTQSAGIFPTSASSTMQSAPQSYQTTQQAAQQAKTGALQYQSGTYQNLSSLSTFTSVGKDWFKSWLVRANVVSELYASKNLHFELLSRSTAVVLFMGRERILDGRLLQRIWSASLGRDFGTMRVIHNLLISLMPRLSHEERMYFFKDCVATIPFQDYDEGGQTLRFISEVTVASLEADSTSLSRSSSSTSKSPSTAKSLGQDYASPPKSSGAISTRSPSSNTLLQLALGENNGPKSAPPNAKTGFEGGDAFGRGDSRMLDFSPDDYWYGLKLLWRFILDDAESARLSEDEAIHHTNSKDNSTESSQDDKSLTAATALQRTKDASLEQPLRNDISDDLHGLSENISELKDIEHDFTDITKDDDTIGDETTMVPEDTDTLGETTTDEADRITPPEEDGTYGRRDDMETASVEGLIPVDTTMHEEDEEGDDYIEVRHVNANGTRYIQEAEADADPSSVANSNFTVSTDFNQNGAQKNLKTSEGEVAHDPIVKPSIDEEAQHTDISTGFVDMAIPPGVSRQSSVQNGTRSLAQRREAIGLLVNLLSGSSQCASQRGRILQDCVELLRRGRSVPQALEVLRRIITVAPQAKASWFSLTESRRTAMELMIERLDKQHKLIKLLCTGLIQYQSRMRRLTSTRYGRSVNANYNPVAGNRLDAEEIDLLCMPGSVYTHLDQLSVRFDFLLFMLTNSYLHLKRPAAKDLWTSLVDGALTEASQDISLLWFARAQASGIRRVAQLQGDLMENGSGTTNGTGATTSSSFQVSTDSGGASPAPASSIASKLPTSKALSLDSKSEGKRATRRQGDLVSKNSVFVDDVVPHLFRENMKTLNAENLSPTAFRVYQSFFVAINYRAKNLRRSNAEHNSTFLARRTRRDQEARALSRAILSTEDSMFLFQLIERHGSTLEGDEFLWAVALEARRNEVGFAAVSQLVHLHTQLAPRLKNRKNKLQMDFVQRCVLRITEAHKYAKSGKDITKMLRQARRASAMLKLFLRHYNHQASESDLNIVVIPPAVGFPGSLTRREYIPIGPGTSFSLRLNGDDTLANLRAQIASEIKVPASSLTMRLVNNPCRVSDASTGFDDWFAEEEVVSEIQSETSQEYNSRLKTMGGPVPIPSTEIGPESPTQASPTLPGLPRPASIDTSLFVSDRDAIELKRSTSHPTRMRGTENDPHMDRGATEGGEQLKLSDPPKPFEDEDLNQTLKSLGFRDWDTVKVLDVKLERATVNTSTDQGQTKKEKLQPVGGDERRQEQLVALAAPLVQKSLESSYKIPVFPSQQNANLTGVPRKSTISTMDSDLNTSSLTFPADFVTSLCNQMFQVLDPLPGMGSTIVSSDPTAAQSLWDCMLLFQADEAMVKEIESLEQDWNRLLPLHATHRLLYALRIVRHKLDLERAFEMPRFDLMSSSRNFNAASTSSEWMKRFLSGSGMDHLLQILLHHRSLTGPRRVECISVLVEMISALLFADRGFRRRLGFFLQVSSPRASNQFSLQTFSKSEEMLASPTSGPASPNRNIGAEDTFRAGHTSEASGAAGGTGANSISTSGNTASVANTASSSPNNADENTFWRFATMIKGRRGSRRARRNTTLAAPQRLAQADRVNDQGSHSTGIAHDDNYIRYGVGNTPVLTHGPLPASLSEELGTSPAINDDIEKSNEGGSRDYSIHLRGSQAPPLEDILACRPNDFPRIVECVLEAMLVCTSDAFISVDEIRSVVDRGLYLIMSCISVGNIDTVRAFIRFEHLRELTEQLVIYCEDRVTRMQACTSILTLCSLVETCEDMKDNAPVSERRSFSRDYLLLLLPIIKAMHAPLRSDQRDGMLVRRAYRNLSSSCSEFHMLLIGLIDMVDDTLVEQAENKKSDAAYEGHEKGKASSCDATSPEEVETSDASLIKDVFMHCLEALLSHESLESFHTDREDQLLIGLLRLLRTLVAKNKMLKTFAIDHGLLRYLYHDLLFASSYNFEGDRARLEMIRSEARQNEGRASGVSLLDSSRRGSGSSKRGARGMLRRSFSGQSLIIHDRSALCKSEASRDAAFALLVELLENCPGNVAALCEMLDEDGVGGASKPGFRSRFAKEWNYNPLALVKHPQQFTGLQNLGATCYMNSFLQQLFHIPSFAEAILSIPAVQSGTLLYQLQVTFGSLRVSTKHFYDPLPLCKSFAEVNGMPLNLTEQRDVYEFASQLFDQIESESGQAREIVQTHFRGMLVNQIISKDPNNPYVSERPDPFHCLPLDIKGCSNLPEALEALVQSELLTGDNQFKLDSGERVDAIKRTCIKELPDHLIINLKRFEFDLQTMTRRKLNDRFEFPLVLDLEPYTYDFITQNNRSQHDSSEGEGSPNGSVTSSTLSQSGASEDGAQTNHETPDRHQQNSSHDRIAPGSSFKYELVGIIAHTGTMDSGHYYSFLRERRPRYPKVGGQWIEFNDKFVWPYPIDCIPGDCFGGKDRIPRGDGSTVEVVKSRSAYVLVYDRIADQSPHWGVESPETKLTRSPGLWSDLEDLEGGDSTFDRGLDDSEDDDEDDDLEVDESLNQNEDVQYPCDSKNIYDSTLHPVREELEKDYSTVDVQAPDDSGDLSSPKSASSMSQGRSSLFSIGSALAQAALGTNKEENSQNGTGKGGEQARQGENDLQHDLQTKSESVGSSEILRSGTSEVKAVEADPATCQESDYSGSGLRSQDTADVDEEDDDDLPAPPLITMEQAGLLGRFKVSNPQELLAALDAVDASMGSPEPAINSAIGTSFESEDTKSPFRLALSPLSRSLRLTRGRGGRPGRPWEDAAKDGGVDDRGVDLLRHFMNRRRRRNSIRLESSSLAYASRMEYLQNGRDNTANHKASMLKLPSHVVDALLKDNLTFIRDNYVFDASTYKFTWNLMRIGLDPEIAGCRESITRLSIQFLLDVPAHGWGTLVEGLFPEWEDRLLVLLDGSPQAQRWLLSYMTDKDKLCDIFLLCPKPKLRTAVASLLMASMQGEGGERAFETDAFIRCFHASLSTQITTLDTCATYFEVLKAYALLGSLEAGTLLDLGFLQPVADLFVAHEGSTPTAGTKAAASFLRTLVSCAAERRLNRKKKQRHFSVLDDFVPLEDEARENTVAGEKVKGKTLGDILPSESGHPNQTIGSNDASSNSTPSKTSNTKPAEKSEDPVSRDTETKMGVQSEHVGVVLDERTEDDKSKSSSTTNVIKLGQPGDEELSTTELETNPALAVQGEKNLVNTVIGEKNEMVFKEGGISSSIELSSNGDGANGDLKIQSEVFIEDDLVDFAMSAELWKKLILLDEYNSVEIMKAITCASERFSMVMASFLVSLLIEKGTVYSIHPRVLVLLRMLKHLFLPRAEWRAFAMRVRASQAVPKLVRQLSLAHSRQVPRWEFLIFHGCKMLLETAARSPEMRACVRAQEQELASMSQAMNASTGKRT